MLAPKFKAKAPTGTGIWTPKHQQSTCSSTGDLHHESTVAAQQYSTSAPQAPPQPSTPIWTPQQSPTPKEFRPVRFESPNLPRRYTALQQQQQQQPVAQPPWSSSTNVCNGGSLDSINQSPNRPPRPFNSCQNLCASQREGSQQSLSSVGGGGSSRSVSDKIKNFERSASVQRPILRQQTSLDSGAYKPNEVIFNVKQEYLSEPETSYERPRKMAQLEKLQYDGIGPLTKDGMPITLRSEVKQPHQHEWYKRLYQTIHKQKNGGRYQYKSNGYQSEPEPNYDSDYSTVRYNTLDRRRLHSTSSSTANLRNGESQDELSYGTMPNPVKSGQNSYKNQPGRIENYTTGHSSVSEKEKKEQQLEQTKLTPHYTEGNLSRALAKESGYTSDSNLVYRKRELPQKSLLSPVEQKEAYKYVQAGGEPPLYGFRKPAPEKPKDEDDVPAPPIPPQASAYKLEGNSSESPSRYIESDVNIHYKTPIRYEYKDPIPEEEIAVRQAEHMQKLYQEERRRKYLQELQDMNARRHTDNFVPSQKSPIPLNRYDDFPTDLAPKSPNVFATRTVARALYNFQGQTARELTFKKGDIIYLRRQIDKNWYEGEHNAMIGLLPSNYVEIIKSDGVRHLPKKPSEGQARAKYNFQAQSGIELSLNKGELVTLTRRVDENWFEGKIANRKGIFPVSYVEVLQDIGSAGSQAPSKLVISSSSVTHLQPSMDALRTHINNEFNTITQNGQQPPNGILRETRHLQKTDALHVDTSSEPLAYRALYKYRPQNLDELELLEGDVVHVLEKCDDGWYVGTSQRTGCFGTFPGNYVERL